MTTIDSLYASRCRDGRPLFWKPAPVRFYPMCLHSSASSPTAEDGQALVKRLITMGLTLELEVGDMVLEGTAKDLPTADQSLRLLLKSNVADEARHLRGFEHAADTYDAPAFDVHLGQIAQGWADVAKNSSNPIAVAGILETGLFLVGLGLLRILGGPSLTALSVQIAEDEFRHIQTNQAVASALGLWDPKPYQPLLDASLEWLWGAGSTDLQKLGIRGLDTLKRFSRELLSNLESPELDSLSWYTTHRLPFELGNEYLYPEREWAA